MKNDPFASNQRFGGPAAGFPSADKDKAADILIKDKGAPNVMTSRVSMKMGSAKVESSLVSFPYLIFYRRKNSATPVMLTSTPTTSLNLMRCLSNTADGISISTGVSAISVDAIPASV